MQPEWWKTADADGLPVITAYRLVRATFSYWGLQTIGEKFACSVTRGIVRAAAAQMFCWTDDWYGMSREEVLKFEEDQNKLAMQLTFGTSTGNESQSQHDTEETDNQTNELSDALSAESDTCSSPAPSISTLDSYQLDSSSSTE